MTTLSRLCLLVPLLLVPAAQGAPRGGGVPGVPAPRTQQERGDSAQQSVPGAEAPDAGESAPAPTPGAGASARSASSGEGARDAAPSSVPAEPTPAQPAPAARRLPPP